MIFALLASTLLFAEDEWDVNAPTGKSIWVDIDVDEGTWMSLDVSPDGKQIVFDLLGDLYTLPIEGGAATPLTSGMAWDMQPMFSHDGTYIVFTSDRGGGDNLWLLDLYEPEKEPISITTESFRLLNSPVFSPDDRYIVGRKHFTAGRSLGAGELWMYDRMGGKGIALTKKTNDQKDLGEPAFSPDGKYIYYSKDATAGNYFEYNKDPNQQIYVIERLELATGKVQRVTGGSGGAIRPTPSPDGDTLAFLRRKRNRTVLMLRDLQSGEEHEIAENLDHDMQETWAIHGVYPRMDWTNDGNNIVYWAKGKIWNVDIWTGERKEIPFSIEDKREIRPALRFPIEVAPETFDVKMIRDAVVSPNREQVVFQALGKLWIKDLPDGTPRRLTSQEDYVELEPSWSQDGNHILFASWNDDLLGGIHKVSVKRGRIEDIDVGEGHFREPIELPNGEILYRRSNGGWLVSPLWSDNTGIFLWKKKHRQPQKLLDYGYNLHLADDDFLYFNHRSSGELTLARFDFEKRDVVDIAKGEMLVELRISSDGDWLSFVEHHNAYVLPFTNTGKPLSVSKSDGSLPQKKISHIVGRDVHIVADHMFWTKGTEMHNVPLKEDLFVHDKEESETTTESVRSTIYELGFSQEFDTPTGTFALVGATAITVSEQGIVENSVVLWRDNRIVNVGTKESITIPKDAVVIDGTGLYILPGLVDVHHHGSQGHQGIIPQQNWKNLSALSFGVTTVHDPSHDTQTIFASSELQKANQILAPRIFSTGRILYGAKSAGSTAKVESYEDAKEHLDRMKAVGAFSVKSYNQPRRDQRQQIVAAARENQMMVLPEGGSLLMHNLTQIIDGHTGIEHAIPVAPIYEDILQLWSQTDVGYTPTLGVAYGGMMGEHYWYAHDNVWEDERLNAFVPQSVLDSASRRVTKIPEEEYHHITISQSAKKLFDRGVSVQIGAHGQREGLAAHWELWMLSQGGMSPLEVIQSGTLQGAKYLGLDQDIGSIEKGKLADFMVLNRNPLEDIRNTNSVQWTILNGRVFDSATMNQIYPNFIEREPLYFENETFDGQKIQEETLCGCGIH